MSLLWWTSRHVLTKLFLLNGKHFDVIIHFYWSLLLHVVVGIVNLWIVIDRITLFSISKASSLIVWFEIWFSTSWILVVIFWYVYSLNFLWWAWLLLIIHIHLNITWFDDNLIFVSISKLILHYILLLFPWKYIIPYFRMPMLSSLWLRCCLLFITSLHLLLTSTTPLRNNNWFIMLFLLNLLESLIRISFFFLLLFIIIVLTFG